MANMSCHHQEGSNSWAPQLGNLHRVVSNSGFTVLWPVYDMIPRLVLSTYINLFLRRALLRFQDGNVLKHGPDHSQQQVLGNACSRGDVMSVGFHQPQKTTHCLRSNIIKPQACGIILAPDIRELREFKASTSDIFMNIWVFPKISLSPIQNETIFVLKPPRFWAIPLERR